jgi:hypothetical protein
MEELLDFYQNKFSKQNLFWVNSMCRFIAFVCALVGVSTLLLFLFFHKTSGIAMSGFFFLVIAFFLNAFLVACLVIYIFFAKGEKEKRDVAITIGIMLLNIPLAAFCVFAGTKLMDYFNVNI